MRNLYLLKINCEPFKAIDVAAFFHNSSFDSSSINPCGMAGWFVLSVFSSSKVFSFASSFKTTSTYILQTD